jgi:excisionase family DNA binding protein
LEENFSQVYTVEEVAKMLKVSDQTVRALIRQGNLPALRIGRVWRIKKEDLRAYMNPGRNE